MTTIPSSLLTTRAGTQVSYLYASAAKSLQNQNPALKTIDAQLKRDETRLSNLGKLAQALDGFRSAANSLATGGLDMSASVSGKGVQARLASASATPGVHTVEVTQLAQAQRLATRALPDKDAALGSGGVTVIRVESGQGGATTIRIEPGNDSLDGIAAAMREAGLDASVVQDGKNYALTLTGKSGAANGMKVSVAGDPALQGLLTWQPGSPGGMRQQQVAQDAKASVDGKALTNSGNTIDGAIPGVKLTLGATGTSEVAVVRAPSAIAQNVKNLVQAFNQMHANLETGAGDAASKSAMAQLEEEFGKAFKGLDTTALAEMGLAFNAGRLELDEAKLNGAIAADPAGVAQRFRNGSDGMADVLATVAARQFSSGSTLYKQADAIEQDMDALAAQRSQITEAASRQAQLLMQQYTMAGSGASSLFGSFQGPQMSAFDFMA